MDTLIVQPKNKEQLRAAKAFFEALKIQFSTAKSDDYYHPEFVLKMEENYRDYEAGKGEKVTLEELDKLWK